MLFFTHLATLKFTVVLLQCEYFFKGPKLTKIGAGNGGRGKFLFKS